MMQLLKLLLFPIKKLNLIVCNMRHSLQVQLMKPKKAKISSSAGRTTLKSEKIKLAKKLVKDYCTVNSVVLGSCYPRAATNHVAELLKIPQDYVFSLMRNDIWLNRSITGTKRKKVRNEDADKDADEDADEGADEGADVGGAISPPRCGWRLLRCGRRRVSTWWEARRKQGSCR